jgi:hypothetical protein
LAARGLIRFVKFGDAHSCHVKIDPDDIDALIEARKQRRSDPEEAA